MRRVILVAAAVAFAASPAITDPARADFHSLCAPDSQASATVHLLPPQNYSGVLTFGGTVRCDGASIQINSVTVTPLGENPSSVSGAHCTSCDRAVVLSGQVPAQLTEFDVAMEFAVTTKGRPTHVSSRLARYVAHWGGNNVAICPVGADESCAA